MRREAILFNTFVILLLTAVCGLPTLYNETFEDNWVFITGDVCNADNNIKLGEQNLVVHTAENGVKNSSLHEELSCTLNLLVSDAKNGLVVSVAGDMSCENTLHIKGSCAKTSSNCEVIVIRMNGKRGYLDIITEIGILSDN